MNIKEAKNQIRDTLRAYLKKDSLGNYLIPPVRQRPILLMGPPGIGKTQIMEQIAAEENVGLVAYTITHHTRQSAVGLPFIEKRTFGGVEYTVTEYTMSEIIASVYSLMEETGIKEGILFLDEINCVSETLAPMMLQFLQCKTFGNQKLPEGWLIAAAGNPPEYNKSVRDFDIVTLDRVKRMDITEDLGVWMEYAMHRGLHGAVISYLDIRKDDFYLVETTADGAQFVTARGWEDLSEIIYAYEKLGIRVDRSVVEQYLQCPRIAKEFANYLALYYKYQKTYHVDEILTGQVQRITVSEFRAAPFDEKLSVMGLLLSRLSDAARAVRYQDTLTSALHRTLQEFKGRIPSEAPAAALQSLIGERMKQMKLSVQAGQQEKETRDLRQREINALEEYLTMLRREELTDSEEAMDTVRTLFRAEVDKRSALGSECGTQFDNAFRFLENAIGPTQEMVLFVTRITAGYDTSWFVENFGCDAYFRNNRELLFDETRSRIEAAIRE